MQDEPKEKIDGGMVQSVVNNLGTFFRHLFPGILIMGGAYVAHPSWFVQIDSHSWQHIVILAVIAVASGNIWFALNRYGVHQVIDLLMCLIGIKGIAKPEAGSRYHNDLGRYVTDSLCASIPVLARQHVAFRASSVLLLYTLGEVGGVLSIWHEPNTLFARHPCKVAMVSLLIFAVGVWQDAITRTIDHHIVAFGRKKSEDD